METKNSDTIQVKMETCIKQMETVGIKNMTNDEILEFYSLYKQYKEGDCNKSKPSLFHPKERAKWSAWQKRKGLSKEEAAQKYIELSSKFLNK